MEEDDVDLLHAELREADDWVDAEVRSCICASRLLFARL